MPPALYTAYLEGSLKLSKYGEWWHNGRPFQNKKVAELFSRSVVWVEEDKSYFIYIAEGRAKFDCEDTAYFVTELCDQKSPWNVRLSDQSEEALLATSLALGSENQIYCMVKDGKHRARFSRQAHQALIAHAVDEETFLVDGHKVKILPSK